MTRQAIIERTIKAINLLPPEKAQAISDFADFISKRYEEHLLIHGIQKLAADSEAFDFLKDEEDLDDKEWLKELVKITVNELPEPKPKKIANR